MLSNEPQWVALYTNPRAEKRVDKDLREAGFESYLPLRRELHSWSDRRKWVETPLLKSYVFVRITKTQDAMVRAINGVVTLVAFNGNIATIPDCQIQVMKDFLAAEIQVQVHALEQLKRGRMARITSGPLEGKKGLLISDCEDGNFAVEISGISMAMVVTVDADLLEDLPDEEQPESEKIGKYNL